MQLLPSTGKKVAKDLNVKHFNPSELYLPGRNLQLGTRYFKSMVDQFGGQFEYALAAYNAGSDRVNDWLGQSKYRRRARVRRIDPVHRNERIRSGDHRAMRRIRYFTAS